LQARLNSKQVEFEATQDENHQVQAVIDSNGNFDGDSNRLKEDYGRILTENLTDQHEKYQEILKGIEEHSDNLKRAKEIEDDLAKMLDDARARAAELLKERLQKEADLDNELEELKEKVRIQEELIVVSDDKIGSLEDEIGEKQRAHRNLGSDSIKDDL